MTQLPTIFLSLLLIACSSSALQTGATPDLGIFPKLNANTAVLEINGVTFDVQCDPAVHQGEIGGDGSAGPDLDVRDCSAMPSLSDRTFLLRIRFRDLDPNGLYPGTTFDLSDPGHAHYIHVQIAYQNQSKSQYAYSSEGPDPDAGVVIPSSGIVLARSFALVKSSGPFDTYTADVELTDVVIPATNGGPSIKIVSAHLYQ